MWGNVSTMGARTHHAAATALADGAGGGALAVQVPANHTSPLYRALREVANTPQWGKTMEGCEAQIEYHEAADYDAILRPIARRLELRETTYDHVLGTHKDMIAWYRSTGMRPYLERLPQDKK